MVQRGLDCFARLAKTETKDNPVTCYVFLGIRFPPLYIKKTGQIPHLMRQPVRSSLFGGSFMVAVRTALQ